jgi:hypothetical protein
MTTPQPKPPVAAESGSSDPAPEPIRSSADIRANDRINPDGSHTVTVAGVPITVPATRERRAAALAAEEARQAAARGAPFPPGWEAQRAIALWQEEARRFWNPRGLNESESLAASIPEEPPLLRRPTSIQTRGSSKWFDRVINFLFIIFFIFCVSATLWTFYLSITTWTWEDVEESGNRVVGASVMVLALYGAFRIWFDINQWRKRG